jgi:hypothetical protein
MRHLGRVPSLAVAALLSLAPETRAESAVVPPHPSPAPVENAPAPFPSRLAYRGLALGADGSPLQGLFAVEIGYFDRGAELLRERHAGVEFASGRFAVELGSGAMARGVAAAAVTSLRELCALHPEFEIELTIGGALQSPRVAILPAGHSTESRLVLAGEATPGDGRPHAEGFRYRSGASAVAAAVLRPARPGAAPASPPAEGRGPFEIALYGPWRSRPLRELPAIEATPKSEVERPEEINPIRHEDLTDARGRRHGTAAPKLVDPLAEPSRAGSPLETPAPAIQFAGVGNVSGVLPPDTTGAVGPEHYVQVVNLAFQVFHKNGSSAGGPYATNTLWIGYGGPCEGDNDGDAIFLWDRYAQRWLFSQFAVTSGDERVCFAVSQTSDPLGAYSLYELVTQRFPDYFKLGVWPDPANDAYFMSTNSGFAGGYDVYALDRASMVAGLPARPAIFFQSFRNLLMPADANGPRLPPAGSPGLLYTFRAGGESYFGPPTPTSDSLDLHAFDVDWTTPGNSTFTLLHSFTPTSGGLAGFNWTVCGFFVQDCLPQPGTNQGIDSASWWPMHRFQYRRFVDHEALVGSWTVDVADNGPPNPEHAAPRWFELRRTGGAWSIFQQGTHAPDAAHRWMPSIAMDGDGNLALGYSVVDEESTLYPSIRYAARAAGDPAGTLQGEQTLFTGSGAQTHSAARWGDYSSMTVDPVDDCTFWYTNEYLAVTGSAPWLTRIGAFTYPGCGGLVVTPTLRQVCGTAGTVEYDVALSGKFDATTDLSVSGCPAGATCLFSPDPVVFPANAATLELSNLGAVATGSYALAVDAVEQGNPTDAFETAVALELWSAVPNAPALAAPANAAPGQSPRPVFSWGTAANAKSYTLEVATDAGFTDVVYTRTVLGTSHTPVSDLPSNETLYWRVVAANPCGSTESPISWFETAALPTDCPAGKTAANVYAYGFEAGASGWTSSGTGNSWAQSSARAHGGATSWHANDPTVVSDQRLVSPAIALPAGPGPLSLRFWQWRAIEPESGSSCYDGGILEVSTNGGGSYTQITSAIVADPYTGPVDSGFSNPLAGLDAWCGAQDWRQTVVDVGAFAGTSAQFRFRLGSDTLVGMEGWYLDDVAVQSCATDPAIFLDGFEVGNATRWSATAP